MLIFPLIFIFHEDIANRNFRRWADACLVPIERYPYNVRILGG